jgi:hypothetical protein
MFSTHQPLVYQGFRVGGEGRNRPFFPAVAPQICLILLAIQAKTVLSERIFFNPFGVRFGVRLPTCPVAWPIAKRFHFSVRLLATRHWLVRPQKLLA